MRCKFLQTTTQTHKKKKTLSQFSNMSSDKSQTACEAILSMVSKMAEGPEKKKLLEAAYQCCCNDKRSRCVAEKLIKSIYAASAKKK